MSSTSLGFTLIAAALILLTAAALIRRRSGLPWGRVIGEDVSRGRTLERPLFARNYGLTGRPDYLIERGGHNIPVELKPSRRAQRPYASDLMQLAAYCLLVEATTGRAPPYGLLRYAETTFRMPYTAAVRAELLATLDAMRTVLEEDDAERSHDEPRRCAGCGLAHVCDETLA